MTKPYRDTATLHDILRDGWSRGFLGEQTVGEAVAMGFDVSYEYVKAEWAEFQSEMEAAYADDPYCESSYDMDYFANDPYHESDDGGIED